MSEQNNRFILYEYLLFFWSKKKYFIIMPVLAALLVTSFVYVLKNNNRTYSGQALIFTGSINSQDLTNPANITANYKKEAPGLNVYVSEKGQVKLSLNGDSKSKIEEQLSNVSEQYMKELMKESNERLKQSKGYIATLEERAEKLETASENYNDQLLEGNLPPDQYDEISALIIETEEELSDALENAHRMKSDLVFFEKPRSLGLDVHPAKSYLKESMLIGIVLGFLAAIGFLVLLKYIEDARRNYTK